MSSGNTFVDDSLISVRGKYKEFYAKTKSPALNVSSIDSADSLGHLDQSFADILNSNAKVTLIRKNIKEKESALKNMENEVAHSRMAGPTDHNKSPPTRLKSDDSFECTTNDWLNNVSDESFLRVEKECESPIVTTEKDTTIFLDIEDPSFLNGIISADSNTFSTPVKSMSVLSPIQTSLSTVIEEATVKCINSNDNSLSLTHEQSVPSSKGSYRASLVNVFPTKRRVGFFDYMEKPSLNEPAKQKTRNEKESILLINFDDSVESAKQKTSNEKEYLLPINFDESVEEMPHTNLSNQQTSSLLSDELPEFNDTLEAVDYFLLQGKKFLDETCST